MGHGVPRACVSNEDFLGSHGMIATSVSRAGINGMAIVDAATNCVTLDNPDAHVGGDSEVIDS